MVRQNNIYDNVGKLKAPRSLLDLSHTKKFDFDMGQLIPVMCEEAVPGDVFNIGHNAVIRFNALIKPILHKVDMKTYYFFVPYRLLSYGGFQWEDLIMRGESGDVVGVAPPWPLSITGDLQHDIGVGNARYSLWDYFGFPIMQAATFKYIDNVDLPTGWPFLAYNFIWNEFFRDQNYQDPFPLNAAVGAAWDTWLDDYRPSGSTLVGADGLGVVLNRNWTRDYFTSVTPFQQRGTPPAVPVLANDPFDFNIGGSLGDISFQAGAALHNMGTGAGDATLEVQFGTSAALAANAMNNAFNSSFNGNTSGFDIGDLRLAMQIQSWMERNMRAGVRYTEFIQSRFPAYPRDDRMQRPEYIGGSSSPVIISEVLQTSETATSPQGNLAGHGIAVNSTGIGKYRVPEYGLVMGLMCVVPKPAYQQGIERQWYRKTTYEHYFPEFANLSEQEVFIREVLFVATTAGGGAAENDKIIGFQGRYNEMRAKSDMVCGALRDTESYWHLGRILTEVDTADDFDINSHFIVCVPRKDIFEVTTVPGLICNFGNNLKVLRPMPYVAVPYSFS